MCTLKILALIFFCFGHGLQLSDESTCRMNVTFDFNNPSKTDLKEIEKMDKTEIMLVRLQADKTPIDTIRGKFVVDHRTKPIVSIVGRSSEGWTIHMLGDYRDYILLDAKCVDSHAVE